MNFIIDNYLWIGIAGVILLMALIGFLAEKTNFIVGSGARTKKSRKRKKEVIDQFIDTDEVVEEPVVKTVASDVMGTEEVVSATDEVLDFSNITTTAEPSIGSAPLGVNDTWTQTVEEVEVPKEAVIVTETGEDLSQPFGESIKVPTEPVVKEKMPNNKTEEDIWKF